MTKENLHPYQKYMALQNRHCLGLGQRLLRLLKAQHQSNPVPGAVLKVKALYFTKELGWDNFHTFNRWLDRWKKDTMFYLKQYQVFFHFIIH